MDPIDYSGAFANVQSPVAAFTQGLQGGAALQQVQAEQAQKQAELAQKQQMQADLSALSANPTPQAIAAASLKYPQLSEEFKRSLDMLTPAQQQAKIDAAGPVHAAVLAGQYGVAAKQLREHADALENSGGEQEAKQTRAMADLIEQHPETAKLTTGLLLASALGPERYTKAFGDLEAESRAADLAPGAVRKANADAGSAELDNATKGTGIVASAAGALAKPGVKPTQVETMFRTMKARGVINQEQMQGYLDGIPTDPKALPDYLKQVQASGMKADDQMKFTTPTADAQLSAKTQVQTTGMNNATSITTTRMNNQATLDREDRIATRMAAKGSAEPTLSSDSLNTMAQQYLAGDKTVMQNLGRGAQGAANIVALREAITQEAKAQGLAGPQIAAKMADYAGLTAGMRTSANISARVENAISEAKELAPLAIAAGREVSRSGLLPFGKVGVMFDTQTNNPALKKFVTANNGLVAAYAGAMARGQKPTVSDYDHAREILAAAQSQPAYEATVNQMFAEMAAASRAPQNVREHLRGQIGGTSGHAATAAAGVVPIPAGWSVREH